MNANGHKPNRPSHERDAAADAGDATPRDPVPPSAGQENTIRTAPGGQINFWTVLDVLMLRWHWVLVGMLIFASLFCFLGWRVVKPKYTATAQLMRFEIPGKSDYFKTAPLSSETFAGLMRSPELLQ